MDQIQIDNTLAKLSDETLTAKSLLNSYFELLLKSSGVPFTYEHRNEISLIIDSILMSSMLMMELKIENLRRELQKEK